jgi:Zn-dependent peptidase ImmA (M78 family)
MISCAAKKEKILKEVDMLRKKVANNSPYSLFSIIDDNSEVAVKYEKDVVGRRGEMVAGRISYNKRSKEFTIYINSSLSAARALYVLVHEYAHYKLHRCRVKRESMVEAFEEDGKLRFDNKNDLQENDATFFAMNFLMPGDVFVSAKKDFGDGEYGRRMLGIRFGMPSEIISRRIKCFDNICGQEV